MNSQIDLIRKVRISLLEVVKDLSIEQLNAVPVNFNNNIIWNLGHIVAAQQGVCYIRAGLSAIVDEKFFNDFKPGSKPERLFSVDEVEEIKTLLFSTLHQLEADYEKDLFLNYKSWTTRYGVELNSIDEALGFLPFHEGFHTGYILALKRVVTT